MTPEEVDSKLVLLAEIVESLAALPQGSLAEFLEDDRTLDAALHRLQVAIQILVDVGGHVVARLGLGAPDSSRDIVDRLEAAGKIGSEAADRTRLIFAFRNRVVHLYDRIDPAVIYEIVVDHVVDLTDLARVYVDCLVA